MGLFDKVNKNKIESRRYEERLYEVAIDEVESGQVRKGLYAKALAEADGDKDKAGGIYLKLRVQSLMDDLESDQIDHKEAQELRERLVIRGEPTLENAKRRVKHTSYVVEKLGGQTYYVLDRRTRHPKHKTTHLLDLHRWLDKNVNQ